MTWVQRIGQLWLFGAKILPTSVYAPVANSSLGQIVQSVRAFVPFVSIEAMRWRCAR